MAIAITYQAKCVFQCFHEQVRGYLIVANRDQLLKQILSAELETYSSKTLRQLHQDLQRLAAEGINGSEVVYRHLIKNQLSPAVV